MNFTKQKWKFISYCPVFFFIVTALIREIFLYGGQYKKLSIKRLVGENIDPRHYNFLTVKS